MPELPDELELDDEELDEELDDDELELLDEDELELELDDDELPVGVSAPPQAVRPARTAAADNTRSGAALVNKVLKENKARYDM